jgi:hypothetical protein
LGWLKNKEKKRQELAALLQALIIATLLCHSDISTSRHSILSPSQAFIILKNRSNALLSSGGKLHSRLRAITVSGNQQHVL